MSTRAAVTSLIVKVAERCNLKCSYCYMYEHADSSFLTRPRFMSDGVFRAMLERARDACDQASQDQVSLVFHGGEPTLIGARRFERFAMMANDILGARLGPLSIQTNGTLLDKDWAAVFRTHGVGVGLSLDGPPEIHDRVRVDHQGKGSWDRIRRGIEALRSGGVEPSILTVVAPGHSGLSAYEFLLENGLRHMDFLLPDVSHDSVLLWYGGHGDTPVADYLIPIFDAWFRADDPTIFVGIFWSLIERLLGGPGLSDVFGNPPMRYLVVETDGAIEGLDALRVCEHGIASSGLNVLTHDLLDLASATPLVAAALRGEIELCETCRKCEVHGACGGGYLPHRYSRRNGFDNPSVWCSDLMKLIGHVDAAVRRRVALEQSIE